MSTNVNISLNNELLEGISRAALLTGRTLSEEIEYRLLMVHIETPRKEAIGRQSTSSRLRGIVTLPENFDYKEALMARQQ